MFSYHYYARLKLQSGNIVDRDGIITTSRAICTNDDYKQLKRFLIREAGDGIKRMSIVSLSCLGNYDKEEL